MEDIDLVTQVLKNYIATISNIEIIKPHVHGRDKCPHFEIQFDICPENPIILYPLRDSRYNNLIEKVILLPARNGNIKVKAQINIQTIQRSFQVLKESENL